MIVKRVLVRVQGNGQKVLTIPRDLDVLPDDLFEFFQDDKLKLTVKFRKLIER